MVANYVTEIKDDWFHLGTQLLQKTHTHILNGIKENNPDSAEKCLDEMLKYWREKCKDTYTWNTLISALEKIDQDGPAEIIKKDDSIKGFK